MVHTVDPATLAPNYFIDSDHPAIVAYAHEHAADLSPREAAVTLFHVIRDGFRYSPWHVSAHAADYKASAVLQRERKEGHCIDKAVLLAACARVLQIPSRLHFANVRNHIGTERLEAQLGTDLLVYHGYVEMYLGERWVAATPAFNAELCAKLGVSPLSFDGVDDAIFQAFDRQAGKFMETVTDLGVSPTVPLQRMFAAWRTHYPHFRPSGGLASAQEER